MSLNFVVHDNYWEAIGTGNNNLVEVIN